MSSKPNKQEEVQFSSILATPEADNISKQTSMVRAYLSSDITRLEVLVQVAFYSRVLHSIPLLA